MKTLLTLAALTLTLTFTLSAQASSRSTECSSADGSVRTVNGRMGDFVQVTEFDWNSDVETPVRDEDGSLFEVKSDEEKSIRKIVNDGVCRNGIKAFYAQNTYSKEVTITKLDGSDFSKTTKNVTPDYKAVQAVLICETTTSNIMGCSK